MIRRPLRLVLRPVLILLALVWVPFAVLAAANLDVTWQAPSALAFLPYGVLATLVVLLVAAALRSWVAVAIAGVGLVVLLEPRAGRVASDDQPPVRGPELVVATSNVFVGRGDTRRLVDLVRDERIDVLAVQEDTPGFTDDARMDGLQRELPYVVLGDAEDAAGISLYSRLPLRTLHVATRQRRSTAAQVAVPGSSMPIEVQSVHPPPPFRAELLPSWKRALRQLRRVSATPNTPTILAGDYNATLDHHPFRALLARGGYRDAADQVGEAWRPTWSRRWQRLTIDHVVVSRQVAVLGVSTHDLPGSDHDVVVSRLRLPR